MKKEKKKGSGKRKALITLCVVLGILLAVLTGGTVYATHLMNQIGRVEMGAEETLSQEELDLMLGEETLAVDDTTPTVNEEEINWGDNKVQIGGEDEENIVNILLIGQDARPEWGRSRSDSMILCTFNKEKKSITLTSFMRDLYVQIPGYNSNRINSASPDGGMELLDETLENNFGVHVDGNVEVDFSHFMEVIDLLGGIDIEIRKDEAWYINSTVNGEKMSSERSELTEGMQHLNGAQALQYSRIRHLDSDGDFSRTSRQRIVINAVIEKFRDSKLTTLLGLLDDLLPMVTTDMSNKEMIALATDLFPMLADCTIVSQRIPADDTYHLAMIRGMSVIVADMDKQRELLKNSLTD